MTDPLAHEGESNGRAVLTSEQAFLIYRLASERTYSQRTIARMFLGHRTVVDILQKKKTWRCLWEHEEEPA
jgi:hypothetical protein